jgi:glycosyltransferase involved in cell wall biosynthesis
MKIIFWLSVLTDHQIFFIRALEKIPGVSVKIMAASEELSERALQGWVKPNTQGLDFIVINYANWPLFAHKLIRDYPDAYNIFGGLWASQRFFLVLLYALWKKKKVGLIAEPFSRLKDGYFSDHKITLTVLRSYLRPLLYKMSGMIFGGRIKSIFAISPLAFEEFEKAHFKPDNIYPFGYFINLNHSYQDLAHHCQSEVLRIVFIGALIKRKGIDFLIELALLCYKKNISVEFDIYGPGNPSCVANISPNLNFCGLIPFGGSAQVLMNYDLLIVPSKYDGWGVVVNEALQSGIPILASMNAGASSIVHQSGAGIVFDPNNILSLIISLQSLSENQEIIKEWKIKAKTFSNKLAPEIAAGYFFECLKSSVNHTIKPECPWYSVSEFQILKNRITKRKIVFFTRKPFTNNFSLEIAFGVIRKHLPAEMECVVAESRYQSKGILRRIYNIVEAVFHQGDVNHVTGDVHFLTFLLARKKTLLTVLDFIFMENSTGFKRWLMRFIWGVIPEKKVGLITVISQSTKNELLKYLNCNPDKVRVVPLPISPGFTRYDKSFNAEYPTILQVGTTKNKNLIRLARALKGIPCRLEIIGQLSAEQINVLRDECIDYVDTFNLSNEEVLLKYRECDLVTFISTYEGFGIPILEANAVGRPVITGNLYSMPEVCGDGACMVDPYNILEMRNGFLQIIADKAYRERIVRNGFLNVKRYEPRIIAEQYAQLYLELLNDRIYSSLPREVK